MRKPNYQLEKRSRDLQKKKNKEEKRKKRQAKRDAEALESGTEVGETEEAQSSEGPVETT